MINDMQVRNLAPSTQRSYIHYAAQYAEYFHRSPADLTLEHVQLYQLHLLNDRRLSPHTVNQFVSATRFLYLTTLERPWGTEHFPHVAPPHTLPVVLSQPEVLHFFKHVPGLKHRAALMTCYAAGLRVSEAVRLQIPDIDSERMVIRVQQGKGSKDRYVMLSRRLLQVLRWPEAKPKGWALSSDKVTCVLRPWSVARRTAPAVAVSRLQQRPHERGKFAAGLPRCPPSLGHPQEDHRAYAAPQFRHTPARKRHRPARHSGPAGA